MKKRITLSVIGVVLCAISVAFFKYAAFGMDSFQVFVNGMVEVIPISYGTLYVIINAGLLLFALIFDKHYIGLATLINLFFLGYIAEVSLFVLNLLFPVASVWLRVLSLVVGIVLMSLACALYYTSDLGVSTYDAIALIMSNTWKWGKFRYCRIGVELATVLFGTILYYLGNHNFKGFGALVSVGTIITAFCMGPLIEFFTNTIAKPLLHNETGTVFSEMLSKK